MTLPSPILRPLGAALLLATAHADAATIDVDVAGDVHVPGHCTLREAVAAANTRATSADTGCAPDIEHGGGADTGIGGAYNLIGAVGEHVGFPPATLRCHPHLQALAWNGGPTPTHALGPDPCAIDAGGIEPGSATDQRGAGHPRWVGPEVDIGAYELDPGEVGDRVFADGFE